MHHYRGLIESPMPVSKATQGVPNLKFLVNQSDTLYVSEMRFQSYEINNTQLDTVYFVSIKH